MPELPDIVLYVERLEALVLGQPLRGVRLANPFVLRSVDPPLERAHGRRVTGVRRVGKRIAVALEGDLFLVLHLMIAGRLRWKARRPASGPPPPIPGRIGLAAFDFPPGTLFLTEGARSAGPGCASSRGRAPYGPSTPAG